MTFPGEQRVVAVIGGTGLYTLDGLTDVEEISVDTPFGAPSSPVVRGVLNGDTTLLFLARHGRGHRILPSEINYRANIFALKTLGAVWCIAVSAVGSLREEIRPGDIVIPDQLIDRTYRRENTFFGQGIVAHVAFGSPMCPVLRGALVAAGTAVAAKNNVRFFPEGTYLCIEGPTFSTRAESNLFRSWGASVVGMTNLPEAKLAREAELAYATIALATDYDCWRSEEESVTAAEVLKILARNADFAKEVIRWVLPSLLAPSELASRSLDAALLTRREEIPAEALKRLEPIVARRFSV